MVETEDDKGGDEVENKAGDEAGDPKDWRDNLELHLEDAKAVAGEIRDKLSDAGKRASEEAREAWKKLEPQIGTAEESLRAATDDAVESLKGMFGDLKGSLSKLRDKL